MKITLLCIVVALVVGSFSLASCGSRSSGDIRAFTIKHSMSADDASLKILAYLQGSPPIGQKNRSFVKEDKGQFGIYVVSNYIADAGGPWVVRYSCDIANENNVTNVQFKIQDGSDADGHAGYPKDMSSVHDEYKLLVDSLVKLLDGAVK